MPIILKQCLAGAVVAIMLTGAVVAAAAAPVSTAGDAPTGEQIAKRWCAGCHLVSPDQKTANADVPSFMEIARRPAGDMTRLKGFLADPHPPMPNLNLTRAEIDNVLAYISSLK